MLNIIPAIQRLYQLDTAKSQTPSLQAPTHQPWGIDEATITQAEATQGVQLPTPLYHFYHEFGNFSPLIFQPEHHALCPLPLAFIGEYLVFFRQSNDEVMWGIHRDNLHEHNPMVYASKNHDAIQASEVHWFAEQPLQAFLLAQAIYQGVVGGLNFHASLFDFTGDTLPANLLAHVSQHYQEIAELGQSHEQYFTDDFTTVVMVSLTDGNDDDHQKKVTAIFMGSQDKAAFELCQKNLQLF